MTAHSNANKPIPTTTNEKINAAVVQAKPSEIKPQEAAGTPPPVGNGISTPSSPALTSPAGGPPTDEDDEKDKIQYFVIVGKVETFPDVSKAETFLNSPDAPQCTVIYGKTMLVNEWHITTGTIHSFASLAKAQKFLKDPGAPKDFVMVRGRITAPEIRVSLRR